MVRQTEILLAVCALSISAQAAPLSFENVEGTQQRYIDDNGDHIQVIASPISVSQPTTTPPPASRIEYWIDEFDNIIPLNNKPSQSSTPLQQRSWIPKPHHPSNDSPYSEAETIHQNNHHSEEVEEEDTPFSEDSTIADSKSTHNAFYRAQVAGYMDIMSKFGHNTDINQEYLNGFSAGVSILVFGVVGLIVLYLAVVPALHAVWRKAPVMGHRRGFSRHSL